MAGTVFESPFWGSLLCGLSSLAAVAAVSVRVSMSVLSRTDEVA